MASSLTTDVVPDPTCPALVIYLLYIVVKVPVVGTTIHLQAVKCTTEYKYFGDSPHLPIDRGYRLVPRPLPDD